MASREGEPDVLISSALQRRLDLDVVVDSVVNDEQTHSGRVMLPRPEAKPGCRGHRSNCNCRAAIRAWTITAVQLVDPVSPDFRATACAAHRDQYSSVGPFELASPGPHRHSHDIMTTTSLSL